MGPGQTPQFHRRELERSIVARFQHIADRFADRPAVTCEGRVITYAALNAAANRIAHALLSAHRNTPQPVGLLTRSHRARRGRTPSCVESRNVLCAAGSFISCGKADVDRGACRPVTMIADQAHVDQARELAPD